MRNIIGHIIFFSQVIPFEQRVTIFQKLLEYDKAVFYHTSETNVFQAMMGIGSVQMTVHRYELGYWLCFACQWCYLFVRICICIVWTSGFLSE